MVKRTFIILALALLGAAGAVVTSIYILSEKRLRRAHPVQAAPLVIPSDSAAVARGAHLATAVLSCTLCHGSDLGGALYVDAGLIGRIVGPNLTRGRGGRGNQLTTDDWVRALRHGVRRNGTSLIVMPSEVYGGRVPSCDARGDSARWYRCR